MLLSPKTIIISGGSQGIGLSIARKCAKEGARVVIAARNKDALEKARHEVNAVLNADHLVYSVDVGDYDKVREFYKWCKKRVRNIHGLVNCAGVYGPIGKLYKIDIKSYHEAVRINFLGTVNICHAFHPLFNSSSRKKIVNFSGGGAATPFPNYSAYATSKIAIVRFTENLALELREEKFDVNCVAPGFVITRLHQQTLAAGAENSGAAFFENTRKQIENGGVSPEIAAELTVFLLSEKSDGITGKFISAPWDPWRDEAFQERLRIDPDLATLRRIDDKTFFKKS